MAMRPLVWAKDQTVITQTVRKKDGEYVASAPTPNPLDKLVLIAIGDEASENTWDALLGVEDIAVFVGCTRRAVQESLRRLERAGFIRCRPTRVESGRSGWQRIYLLAEASPLVQGVIEVDFSTVEEISRFQMRTFRDRQQAGFVPSDSRTRKAKTAARGKGEPGSPSKAGVNLVRPPRVNDVRPKGEPGSPSEDEPGSPPSFSTQNSSPSEESEGVKEASSQEENREPAEWALDLIAGLEFGKHKRPNRKQAVELARLVEAAHTEHGLTVVEIRRWCQATLNEAIKSGVAYLRGGLAPDRLPIPKATDRPAASSSATESGRTGTVDPELRKKLVTGWKELASNVAN